jgi:uncharacterized protein (DUF342 family)
MSIDVAASPLPPGLLGRADGVYADPDASRATLAAAVDALYRGGSFLAGLDYPALLAALFGHESASATASVRLAARVLPFAAPRRALYRAVKIGAGSAAYVFEPVFMLDPGDPGGEGRPARLDVDEFIADMWVKGIRFGIDVAAVRAAIAADRPKYVTVARRLEPVQGQDARIAEVSSDIHRNDAPRQLANGRLDLGSFQNRFPQIQPGVRLLQKIAATAGSAGFEMSGAPLPPKPGQNLDLGAYAGEGTAIESGPAGEFLVSKCAGFLQVDAKTSRISVSDKIVSRDGVSARTTGNLSLEGDYEEFGDVQEKRAVEGESITVHGNVFGRVASRGGTVLLQANLVGGSAENRRGDIRVRGVASNAVLRASQGEVVLERAENCVVSGTRVRVAHAVNCEIIGDEVVVGQAEGSAIAGRRVTVGACAPRKQGEMLVCALRADAGPLGAVIEQVGQRVAQFAELAARTREAMQQMTAKPDVRRYLMLSSRLRKNELKLTPEQARQFQQMAQDVGPALKAIAEVSNKVKALEAERQAGQAMLATLEAQRRSAAVVSSIEVGSVQGETQVRVLGFDPAASAYDLGPREIRQRLRGSQAGELLFGGASGRFAWSSEQMEAAAAQ